MVVPTTALPSHTHLQTQMLGGARERVRGTIQPVWSTAVTNSPVAQGACASGLGWQDLDPTELQRLGSL